MTGETKEGNSQNGGERVFALQGRKKSRLRTVTGKKGAFKGEEVVRAVFLLRGCEGALKKKRSGGTRQDQEQQKDGKDPTVNITSKGIAAGKGEKNLKSEENFSI